MPIYEYKCVQCSHQFDLWQEVGAAAPDCPECGHAVKKIFHPVSVHYKGSGFYITDSRPKNNGGSKAASSGDAANDAKSSSDKAAADKTDSAKSSDGAATSSTSSAGSTASESKVKA